MTDEQTEALGELEQHAKEAVRAFWVGIVAWEEARGLGRLLPGGPQALARTILAEFAAQQVSRGKDSAWIRQAIVPLARMGIDWLSPGASQKIDLSGDGGMEEPGPSSTLRPEGPAGPEGPSRAGA